MNKSSKFLVAAALATVGASEIVLETADAALIASIGFEGRTIFPTTPPGGAQLLTSAQMSTGYIAEVGTGTVYGVHTVTNSVWSYPVGNGTTTAMSATGWSNGDSYWEFEVPTDEFQDILVSFDQVSSSTGPAKWKVQYKVGASGSYVDFANYDVLNNGNSGTISNPAWSSSVANTNTQYTFDLSAISAIEDVSGSNVFFRLIIDGTQRPGTSTLPFATTGTNRIDNIAISGTPIPEPATAGLLTAAASALLVRRRQQA